jgi:hypothetical protein
MISVIAFSNNEIKSYYGYTLSSASRQLEFLGTFFHNLFRKTTPENEERKLFV